MSTMVKTWGIAQFYGMGSMQYLLESGGWLADHQLTDGAPITLFETVAQADEYASKLPQNGEPHGVQFMVDQHGKVLTARSTTKGQHTTKPKAMFTVKRRSKPMVVAVVTYNQVSQRMGKVLASEPIHSDFTNDDLIAAAKRLVKQVPNYDVILPVGVNI